MALRAILLLAAASPAAALNFSRTFGSHMVLQASRPAILFGFDAPGATVSTTVQGAPLSNTTGADGVWRLVLPAQPPSATPFSFTVASSASASATIDDVLFGDVYFMFVKRKPKHPDRTHKPGP